MSSTANQVWEAISQHSETLAEQAGRAVVAIDAGNRVAASGVHWKPGVIVTASHLVRRATEVSVILPNGETVKGTIAGRDHTTDLAAVRMDSPGSLSIAPYGTEAKVGELVLAVARSGRGELSASAGIIARVGGAWSSWRGGKIDRLLRPDVRLYPGQSGSALVNGRGELLGINSAVLARESVITLPPETVDRVVSELLERGHIARPYLGISAQGVDLPEEWRSPDQENGIVVVHVALQSAAQQAGIKIGDVLLQADGKPLEGIRQLHHLLVQKRSGESLKLRLLRGGEAKELEVRLGERPQS